MNYPNSRIPGRLVLSLAGALALPFSSASAHDYFQSQLGILVEYYEIDHAALPPMLREYQKQPDASGLLKQVQEMAKNGAARMTESGYLVTRSGQRAKIESMREFIYPTEWEPAELPQKLSGPIDRDVQLVTPATPTAYEMRPVGNTLEVDPVITADGNYVDLNIAPELVEFHGFKNWGHDESTTPMPLFHSTKTSTAMTVKLSGTELLGVFTPSAAHGKEGKGKRVLGFVSAYDIVATTKKDFANFEKDPEKFMEAHPVEDNASDPFKSNETTEVADPFAPGAGENAEVEPEAPRQISILAEYIEVDAAMASQIVRRMGPTADATSIRQRLDGVIRSGKATLLESSSVTTRSGQRAKNESTREFIYPTEYDPAERPQDLHGPIERGVDFMTSVGATAFEMRPLGITLEVDPVISSDGRIIELNIAPECVEYIRDLTYGKGPSTSEQPLMESVKISTAVTVANGTSILIGIHSLETARAAKIGSKEEQKAVRNRRILVFVTAAVKILEK